MSVVDESGTLQAIEAARQRPHWRLVGFDAETDGLVFHSGGQRRRLGRSDPAAWLVCHSPRYVRLEDDLDVFEVMKGRDALGVMRHPPPACVLTESAKVLLERSDAREFCSCPGETGWIFPDLLELPISDPYWRRGPCLVGL